MDRAASVNFCLGVLGLLLLQGVLSTEGRSIFNLGNHVLNSEQDMDAQSRILALLLHKSLKTVERNDTPVLELARKLSELEELQALREDLEMERELTASVLAEGKPLLGKRAEPCFWKYCV